MEIKANIKTEEKKVSNKGTGVVQTELMKKSAESLAGFLIEKGRVPSDAAFKIRGLINSSGQKMEFSYGLFVNGKPVGAYRAIPASRKGKKPVRAKSFGLIKDDIKTFDLETGLNTPEIIKGV